MSRFVKQLTPMLLLIFLLIRGDINMPPEVVAADVAPVSAAFAGTTLPVAPQAAAPVKRQDRLPASPPAGRLVPVVLPPAIYDYPFQGPVLHHIVDDTDELLKWCPPGKNVDVSLACAYLLKFGCFVVRRSDDFIWNYGLAPELVIRHEIGHCNGWAPNHPDARVNMTPPMQRPAAAAPVKRTIIQQ